MNIVDFIKKTPKSELHLHIEGTLEPGLMFELAKKNKITIPFKNVEEVKAAYNFTNLESFLKISDLASKTFILAKFLVIQVVPIGAPEKLNNH